MNSNIRRSAILILILILTMLYSMPAYADIGPKPSVHVTISSLADGHGLLFATLLGESDQYGPYQAVDGSSGDRNRYKEGAMEAFDAFCAYKDQDGYFFWGQVFEIRDGSFSWTYYPPEDFKILVYDSGNGEIYASGKVSRYAFDSYYSVSLRERGALDVTETPYLTKNILSFVIRVVLTLLIELLIAWLFGYRIRKEIRLIMITNIVTQILLNLILSLTDYYAGLLVWIIFFPVLEFGVLLIEMIIYLIGLRSHSKIRAVIYAITANLLSAGAGLLISISVR